MNRRHSFALFLAMGAGFYGLAIALMGTAPFDYRSMPLSATLMWISVLLATVLVTAAGRVRAIAVKERRW